MTVPPRRVVVQGASRSGKTTLAKEIARRPSVPSLELDAPYHQARWTPMDRADFRERANEIVFLDLSKARVIARLLLRTVRRGLGRQELWNGNRESLRNVISKDPQRNVVLWSWKTDALPRPRSSRGTLAPHAAITVLAKPDAVTRFQDSFSSD